MTLSFSCFQSVRRVVLSSTSSFQSRSRCVVVGENVRGDDGSLYSLRRQREENQTRRSSGRTSPEVGEMMGEDKAGLNGNLNDDERVEHKGE